MPDPTGLRLLPAGPGDAPLLRDLEREANLVALAHVFPAATHPFPDSAVEQRWVTALQDPEVAAWVAWVDGPDAPGGVGAMGFVAHDGTWVRQVAVRPDAWGGGLGSRLLDRGVDGVRARGGGPRLWCLRRNERALGWYARRGWRPSGAERAAVHAPHPVEVELVLVGPRLAGSGA